MASIKDLKKDINYVLGDIIEAVYILEDAQDKPGSKEGSAIIDDAIETFDALIAKVNQRDVEDPKKHLKGVRKELEEKANALIKKLNAIN